jgi:phosphatidylinositol alpha-mannosyltransferase
MARQSKNTPLKIVYLLDDTLDKTDGVQQSVITLGEHMHSLGHEVHYLVAQTERIYPMFIRLLNTFQ